MGPRFACALAGLALLCFPARGENSTFDDAVTKAARISGLWEATPDQAQLVVFSPELPPVTHLFLNIHTWIHRNGDAVETTTDARVELEDNLGFGSRMIMHSPIFLRHDGSIGDALEFSGFLRCCEVSPDIVIMRVVPGGNTHQLTVLISRAGKSTYIEFASPPANPNAPVQGDWIAPGSVLHIYVMEPYRVAATFDRISLDQIDLGYPFSDAGSDLKTGTLMMLLDDPNAIHSFDGKLNGSNLLRVQWHGNGFLSGPEFHRLVIGNDAQPVVSKP
jgi:hypothetical protein